MAPIDDFSLVDSEAVIVVGGEARNVANGAVDIDGRSARATDQVMMIVADAVFETGRRTGRLDSTNEVLFDEYAERVVDRLAGDCADDVAHVVGELIGGAMAARRYCVHDGEPLGGHLHAVAAKKLFDLTTHEI